MSWILHDTHDTYFRSPFGAVCCGTRLVLRLKVCSEGIDSVHLRVWAEENESNIEMKATCGEGPDLVYEAAFDVPSEPCLLWYYFFVIRSGQVYYYGNNVNRLGGKGQITEHAPASFQVTVYSKDFSVPSWLSEAVMYQIFPDRFYNSLGEGRVNNPKKGALIHGNWHDSPLYIRDPKTKAILRWDFFGGDLAGIIEKLPYLQGLGITVLYLNPVFEASSNHRYDTGDYKKVDPMLGDNETFKKLCAEAAKMGIRIILDGVFSHTGSDSIYFNREGNYQGLGAYQSSKSPYYKWYRFIEHPHVYESWWGIGTLPNVNEMEPSYRAFIIDDEDSVIKFWLRMGAKGWRLDVADELPDEFIKRMRTALKEKDPSSVLIGEVWEDASNKVSYGKLRSFLWGEELDTVMNYPFRKIFLSFLLGETDANHTHLRLMSLYENYPRCSFFSCMNLAGSHDVPRILTLLGEGRPEEELQETEKETTRLSPAQRRRGMARLKLMALLQMTFPGTPCIYYGDEAGMEGYSDPYNRGPFPWGKEDQDLLSWYKKVIRLRNNSDALKKGEWKSLFAQGDIYSYLREYQTEKVVVAVNRSVDGEIREIELNPGTKGVKWRDVIHNGQNKKILFHTHPDGVICLSLPPLTGTALIPY